MKLMRTMILSLPDGRLVEVWENTKGYDGWEVVVGGVTFGVDKAVRYRDGGTTLIDFGAGRFKLRLPSPFKNEENVFISSEGAPSEIPLEVVQKTYHDGSVREV